MKIKIYTLPTCIYCKMTKEFLKKEGQEFDVEKNESNAEEMIKISGQRGTPVINVEGKIIVGFNKKEIKSVLNKKDNE